MSVTTELGAGDLIVEPIAEAVALYDDLLEQLREFMVSDLRHTYTPELSPCCRPAIGMHNSSP